MTQRNIWNSELAMLESVSWKLVKFTCQMEADLFHHIPDPLSIWKPPSKIGPWRSPTPKATLASIERKSSLSSSSLSIGQSVFLILYHCPLRQKIPGVGILKIISVRPSSSQRRGSWEQEQQDVRRLYSIHWDFSGLAPTPNLFDCWNRRSEMR